MKYVHIHIYTIICYRTTAVTTKILVVNGTANICWEGLRFELCHMASGGPQGYVDNAERLPLCPGRKTRQRTRDRCSKRGAVCAICGWSLARRRRVKQHLL